MTTFIMTGNTMKKDLTWTGNQFLDSRAQTEQILSVVEAIDLTNKDEVWSESVAAAVADRFGVPASFVRVAAGATQVIDAVLRSFYHGLVVDVTPNFHLTASISRQEGWNYHSVPVREPSELLPAVEPHAGRSDAVIVLSSPRNPLGYQFGLEDLTDLLDRAKGVVVLDEVYADFAPETALELVEEYENLVVVRTFSKAWGLANLRIGFSVSAAFARDGFSLRLIPNNVSGIAQRAARHLLAHPEAVYRSIEQARACRDQMSTLLKEIPGLHVWPSDANYICVESPAAQAMVDALDEAGYVVRQLHALRGYPRDWPRGVRITVPTEPDIHVIVERIRHCHTAGLGRLSMAAG